jgi:hypothetical protein
MHDGDRGELEKFFGDFSQSAEFWQIVSAETSTARGSALQH